MTDAKGEFAKTQHGGDSDGVSSANPRVLSGKKWRCDIQVGCEGEREGPPSS